MRRGLTVFAALFCLVGGPVLAQWSGGLDAYPGGYLLMSYHILSGGKEFTYTLELTPQEDGTYQVRTEVVGDASLEEIADATLFFTWQPSIWFSEAWWLPYYFMLFGMGVTMEPNRTYILPGGLSLATQEVVTVAGVRAVKGILTEPGSTDERVIIAISPAPAVPYPVLIRQERNRGGDWTTVYEMELTRYEHRP